MNTDEIQQLIKEVIEQTINPRVQYEIRPHLPPGSGLTSIILLFDGYGATDTLNGNIITVADDPAEYIKQHVLSAVYRLTEVYFLKHHAD